MSGLLYRYNRFTKSYLINYHDFEFEVEPELFTIISTYYQTKNYNIALDQLRISGIELLQDELQDIIAMVEKGKTNHSSVTFLRSRTFKILDFKIFNLVLDHARLMWILFLSLFIISLVHAPVFIHFLFLPRSVTWPPGLRYRCTYLFPIQNSLHTCT